VAAGVGARGGSRHDDISHWDRRQDVGPAPRASAMAESVSALTPGGLTAAPSQVPDAGPARAATPDDDTPATLVADTAAEGFARVYEALFPPVYGYVRFRVRDVHAAEDLTALVFERALGRLATVRDASRVRAWVFGIARNAVADYRRRGRTILDLDSADALEHLWVESPEGGALRREERRRLAAHLAALSDRERELIGLRFAAGLPNREIGEICGLTEANVAQIVHRAIVKLRGRFGDEEHDA
jgi:RNA polymerase sigma factor (sigma-70 family)